MFQQQPGGNGLTAESEAVAVPEGDRYREVLHGRDAGFSVDRVVSPAPGRAAAVSER
ncbi:hypothetical protein [Nocardia tengchongensis]